MSLAPLLCRELSESMEIGLSHLMERGASECDNKEVLSQFFKTALMEVQERGIRLSFEPIEVLIEVNAANRDSWRPLIPLFDARHEIPAGTSFCLVGRNASGDVVATQAARLYDWSASDFATEAQSLRMFYSNPRRSKLPDEACTVTAVNAPKIMGRVVFSGAGWYRRDYRKMWLSGLLPRLSRAVAYSRWHSDFTISIMAEAVIAGGMAARCGYTNVEYEVALSNGPVGDVRCALVWMGTDELWSDLHQFNIGALVGQPKFLHRQRTVLEMVPRAIGLH
jgi:hypothetical protein